MTKSGKKTGRKNTFTFNDDTMALVAAVVEATPDDNIMALFSPVSGMSYFGLPGPLLKQNLVGGRDSKRYTTAIHDFGRGIVGHVYKAWMPSQHSRLELLVAENEQRALEETRDLDDPADDTTPDE